MTEVIKTDLLIIGSGIAGLSLALDAAKLGKVVIITKKERYLSNTNWAQGGIAAVLSEDDSIETHIKDTISAGVELCDEEAVRILVTEGVERVKDLICLGIAFSKKNGKLDLAKEGGHSKHRVAHVDDVTGKIIEEALLKAASLKPNIEILEHHTAIDLITNHHLKKSLLSNNCYGVYAIDNNSEVFKKIVSRFTVMASGGAGQVYLHTTNPSIATGDGVAMAYRAGAKIQNMEFVQFHPTSLFLPKSSKRFLITEALRGAGAKLRLKNMALFMHHYDHRESLAPRDIVARAIDFELKKSGEEFVCLDATHLNQSDLKLKFPNIYQTCLSFGIDMANEPIPVVPSCHYFCGGIQANLYAQTTIHRLYAIGETACTNVHGANRLASNSLLEATVFSRRAFQDISANWDQVTPLSPETIPDWDVRGAKSTEEWILISHNRRELQQVMNDYVGIVRSDLRLERALRRINFLKNETEAYYKKTNVSMQLVELRNLIEIAQLVARSSLMRKESRGLHYTTDYSYKDNQNFLKQTFLQN